MLEIAHPGTAILLLDGHAEGAFDTVLGGAGITIGTGGYVDTSSIAAFADVNLDLTERLHLGLGARWTQDTKTGHVNRATFLGAGRTPLTGGPSATPLVQNTLYTNKKDFNDFSPRVALSYDFSDDITGYVSWSNGFKSGGFNGRANSAAEATEYKPETMWSYEAGFKSRIADQLTLNGAIFHNDYKDFQARVAETDEASLSLLTVLNVGSLRIRGAELEAAWTPIDRLLIDAQVGYLDAEYREFTDDRFPDDSRAFQTPAFAPKWTLRMGAQYGFDLGSSGTITLGGQTRYKSRTALAVDNTFVNTDDEIEGLFQKGYWVHDARIVYETADKHFALGLYGNNLSERAYKTDAQEFSSVGNIRTVYYGAPRTFTLRLTARY